MSYQERDQSIRLSDVLRRISRRWRTVVTLTLVGAAAGAGYSFVQQTTYTASATLTVSPITTNPFNAGAVNQQINITTEREILRSREVARIASEALDRNVSPAQLLAGSEVAAPSGSQVLEVTVTAGSPDDAAEFANALAQAYLDFRAEGAAEVALGFIEELDRRITTLEGSESLSTEDRSELSALRDQRASLSLVAENPGRIIGEAAPPDSPSSPGFVAWLLIGAALGLLIGIAAAFLRDRFDPFVRNTSRMRERTDSRVVTFDHPHDDAAARSVLRAILEARRENAGETPFTVMLTSPSAISLTAVADLLRTTAERSTVSAQIVQVDSLHLTPTTGSSDEAELLLLDTSGITESSAIASLARAAGYVLIIADQESRISDVERYLRDTSTADNAALTIFVQQSEGTQKRPSGVGRRTLDRRAEVS